ncbi:MAG: hypothetical protein WCK32_04520 [Chlorobiaceae bacterium]
MIKKCNKNIEAEVENTIHLLDDLQPLEVHHQFRTLLMQKINNEYYHELKQVNNGFSQFLDLRIALMALLIIINFFSGLLLFQNNDKQLREGISEVLDSRNNDYTNHAFAYYDQTTLPLTDDNRIP